MISQRAGTGTASITALLPIGNQAHPDGRDREPDPQDPHGQMEHTCADSAFGPSQPSPR